MSNKPAQFINGRIVGGHSMHDSEKPELCAGKRHEWRTVECGGHAGEDRDIDECSRCGKQQNFKCSFDEDFS